MPTLKQLICSVEWEGSPSPLDEFHTVYGDGYVETYIAVPDGPVPFSVHLQSNGYIAPGLSMFVYMDGVYQCNRNRRKLKIEDKASSKTQTEVDFVVRQKEQMLKNGFLVGRPWRFNRLNTIPEASAIGDGPAPHNGEYVGTIEVVVLRCHKRSLKIASTGAAATPVNAGLPSSANDQPANAATPAAVTSDASAGSQQRHKSKNKPKAKSKAKNSAMGLDGSWDDPNPPKLTANEEKKVSPDPWDNPPMLPVTTEESSSKPWDCWDDPPPVHAESNMGTVEMANASKGIYHPVNESKKAESRAGSQAGTPKGSHWDKANETSSKTGQQSPASVRLRGGGPGSQSITSHRSSGRHSPLVVNNSIVYNGVGTPPPLSAGPPPAREFWKNMDAIQAAKDPPKTNPKSGAAPDPWDNPPAHLFTQEHEVKDKVDDWNTGPSSMPGGWDTFDKPPKNSDAWGASNHKPQGASDWPDANGNEKVKNGAQNGEASGSWDQPADKGSQSGGNWNLSNIQVNENGNDQKCSDEADNQQDNDWGNFESKPDMEANDWNTANADDHQQEDESPKPEPAPGSPPEQIPTAKKENQPLIRIPGSAKGSKAGSRKSNSPKPQTKGQPSIFNWFNRFSKNEPEASSSPAVGKKPSSPGAWSPPMVKSTKEASPLAAAPTAAEAGAKAPTPAQISIPTSAGLNVKPYWSTWRESSARDEKPTKNAGSGLAEAPIYTLSEDLLERNKTTHQVRPSYPIKYSHNVSRPRYMDTFEQPYAVFVFKYRDKETIESILNTIVTEPEGDEKTRLSRLPKDQLVEQLLRTKSRSSSGSRHSSGKATYKSNPFGINMSPNASALTQKLSKLESSRAPTPEKVGGWLENADKTENDNADGGPAPAENKDHNGNNIKKGDDDWGGFNTSNDNWDKNDDKKDENIGNDAWNTNQDTNTADEKNDGTVNDTWNTNNAFTTGGNDWPTNDPNETSAQKDNTGVGDGWGFDNKDNNNASPKPGSTTGGDGWGFSSGASPSPSKKPDTTTAGDGWGFNNNKNTSASPTPSKKSDAAAVTDWTSNDNDGGAWPSNDDNDKDWDTSNEQKEDEKPDEEKKDDDWNASGFGVMDMGW